ncbi:MAG TPA: Ig-like domain-containing protein [Bacteroidota bacterium]|nr:Ig-like domain-containing protein [Bacteroidota bacterium]
MITPSRKKKVSVASLLASTVVAAVVLFGCAGQAPPPGGPPDTTPPEIIGSFPLPNALHFKGQRIALKFSEYVDRSSVEQSVFFSPPVGFVTFDWGGTDVEISFTDSLHQNTTYIMTLGTDVMDRRNHNKMASAFALPFSTGERIDSAAVEGKVFATPSEGVMIFAYKLNGISADTLNPAHTKPYYLTQSGKDGTFRLTNISPGLYRLIAVRDQYKNLLYDPQIDEFGTPNGDIVVEESVQPVRGINFRMAKEDTSSPFVSSAKPTDRSHVVIRLSEPFKPATHTEDISIVDTLKGSRLEVTDVAFPGDSPADIQLLTARQDSGAGYRLTLSHLQDLAGNVIAGPAASGVFSGSSAADTVKPGVSLFGIQDSARNVQWDDTLTLAFTEGVARTPIEHSFSMHEKGTVAGGELVWSGSSAARFIPSAPLQFGTWYSIRIPMDSIRDAAGNCFHDSLWTVQFRTMEEKLMGSLGGKVQEEHRSPGKIIVTVSELSGRKEKSRETTADTSGAFRFDHLPEGYYKLFAFRDADSNGVYTFGKPFPFTTSEKFSPVSDSLKVRARWPLEGVVVKLP